MTKKLFILFVLISTVAFGQKEKVKESNQDYKDLAYIDAQKMYLSIVKNGYENKEVFEKLGDTYYYNNDYTNANLWYSKVFQYDPESIDRDYYFKYIQTLKAVREYEKADQILNLYAEVKGEDQYLENYLNQPNYLEKIKRQSGRYEIKNLEMNSEIQDFGTSYLPNSNSIVYASSQDTASLVKRRHKWNERVFLNLYKATADSITLELSDAVKLNKALNTKFHESNAVFTKDGNTMYFTRNNYIKRNYKTSSDEINKLKILKATRENATSPWENITELPFNSDEFSTAHPALSKDGKRLFFASDRPGSMTDGNNRLTSDIWYVTIDENGDFSEPVNVNSVNTIGNDLFPFISDNGDFYYSSTGHQGLGGLDVYVVQTNDKGMPVKEVINIGKPVNSSYDDFAFIIKDSLKTGYFSSNRKSGKGLDDIYSFKQTKDLKCVVDINGIVTNEQNGELMPFATVTLLDKDNKKIKSIVVGEDAAYSFVLECGQNYSIRAQKEDFSIAEEFVQTPKISTTLEQPLAVAKAVEDKVVDIKVGDDLNDILDLNMIYFDFDKHNIRYDAEIELQKVLAFMKAYPNSIIDIRSHTDSRASDGYNIKLSDRRAKSTRAYLIMKGIKANRLTARGYGEYQLVNECSNGVDCTEEQHQLNRRSEFIIMKLK